MKTTDVSLDDGRRCASLIQFLTKGRWDLSGADVEELVKVKKWVHDIALSVASQLKDKPAAPPQSAAPAGGFKVKAMGPIGGSSSTGKKSSRKKK